MRSIRLNSKSALLTLATIAFGSGHVLTFAQDTAVDDSPLRLPALEMIKGFDLWERHPRAELALFENHLDVARVARDIRSRFRKSRPRISALLVRDHGPTVWGTSLQQAYNRFEVVDFLLSYLARR